MKNKKTQIVAFEIFTLIVAIFAFAYLIHETDKLFGEILPVVSAESSEQLVCCPKMENGAICQEIYSENSDQCAMGIVETRCDELSICQKGCCIDEDEGLCAEGSTIEKCQQDGGVWEDDENCNLPECQLGCCVLGSETIFSTETRCRKLSSLYGFEKDFRPDINIEVFCIALSQAGSKGACVFENSQERNTCKFTTAEQCAQIQGNFHQDLLCSNANLDTDCERQASISCVDNKDEIYWFDSCGNQENIYSSDKDKSWNNGIVLSKSESCNPNSANVNSKNCGNCDYSKGSVCTSSAVNHVKDGNFICQDVNCVDSKGNKRKNGESWCEYDSYIGDGKDTVGSRHWKYMCIDGEIKTEPCADYRNQICVESEIQVYDSDETFSQATCKTNQAMNCLNYNSNSEPEKIIKNCEDNEDCVLKQIDVDKGFKFDFCAPKYPTGFDLSNNRGQTSADSVCSLANQKCTVIYKKSWSGKWKCKVNCDCEDREFVEQMNDLCISLGDCGSYVNYVGEGTDNLMLKETKNISWTEYKKYAEPVKGQKAEIENISRVLESVGFDIYGEDYELEPGAIASLGDSMTMVGGIIGAGGYLMKSFGIVKLIPTLPGGTFSGAAATGPASLGLSAYTNPTLAGVANAAMAVGIGMVAGQILSSLFGLEGEATTIMAVAGAIAGVAYVWSQGWAFTWSWTAFAWAAVALLVVAVILKALGIGKTKKVIVEFQCLPWQAPVGGDDCEKCNEDELKPCTKYRCQSLGASCGLLNENSENPICVDMNPDDNSAPKITLGNISEGYDFKNPASAQVKIRTDSNECLPEFTPVIFSLKTNEHAQCKYEFSPTRNFEEMSNYASASTLYRQEHFFSITIPSLESLEVQDVTGNIKEKLGNMKMYVRCQDTKGNFNVNEYVIDFCLKSGPDETAARIVKQTPETGSYIKYGETTQDIKIYLNEPAECKYDVSDNNYELMSNQMDCETDLESSNFYGWECNTTLTNLDTQNKIYIKCKDKPWEADDSLRNINAKGFEYELIPTTTQLSVSSVSPSGTIVSGVEPISVELEATTSGGSDNGKAVCSYRFNDGNFIIFKQTYSTQHSQTFSTMTSGKKDVEIKCEDSAKNIAYGNTSFILDLDETAPRVVRVFNDAGELEMTTNEDAECYYDLEKCNFDIENATKMTTGFSKEHHADLIDGQTYYIKCEDVFGNYPGGCTIKVAPAF